MSQARDGTDTPLDLLREKMTARQASVDEFPRVIPARLEVCSSGVALRASRGLWCFCAFHVVHVVSLCFEVGFAVD